MWERFRQETGDALASEWFDRIARFGFVAKGAVFGTVGVMAILSVVGATADDPDVTGAFEALGDSPATGVLLVVLAVGLIAYTIWRFLQAFADVEGEGGGARGLFKRAAYFAIGAICAGFAIYAVAILLGMDGSGEGAEDWTAMAGRQSGSTRTRRTVSRKRSPPWRSSRTASGWWVWRPSDGWRSGSTVWRSPPTASCRTKRWPRTAAWRICDESEKLGRRCPPHPERLRGTGPRRIVARFDRSISGSAMAGEEGGTVAEVPWKARVRRTLGLAAVVALAACSPGDAGPPEGLPESVRLTWLSVTNWLLEAGETRILLDAGFSRVDRSTIVDWSWSTEPARVDADLVRAIADAVIPERRLDWILVGHGHFDHSLDAPALADMTGARIAGARTVCHQAAALGFEPDRCSAVEGGEVIQVSPAVRVRVVRWHHSGASTSDVGRLLRAPLELRRPPTPDPETGGLRPGVHEDYPNGGGSRAYLVTVQTTGGPVTLFWTNTGNPEAWDVVLPPDTAFLRERGTDMSNLEWAVEDRPTRQSLAEALDAERPEAVHAWLGMALPDHVRQVAGDLRPRAFVPHHWDDFWAPVLDGVPARFERPDIAAALEELGVRLVVPSNYFDRFRLDPDGLHPEGDGGLRARLGVPDR